MAKKRVEKKKAEEVKPTKVQPLMSHEGQFFQELVNASNRYAELLKQEAQYKFIAARLQNDRKKIQTGEIKPPIQMTLIPKLMYYQENDKKKVLAVFDEQIKSYNNSLISLKGQIDHRYEDYMESAARNKAFLNSRFKDTKVKSIVPVRDVGEKDEEILFEAEFKDLLKNPKKQQELKKAQKEAVKRNISRKTKA